VDINTGDYVTFNETLPISDLPTVIVSSASLPFIFPHRQHDGKLLMDGGTVWNTNLVSAVDRCMELVDDSSKIIIDIILCDTAKLKKDFDMESAMGNYLRY